MSDGPGKYDDLATLVREKVHARTVVVIVLGGDRGSGFSTQSDDPNLGLTLPAMLRHVATEIERSS